MREAKTQTSPTQVEEFKIGKLGGNIMGKLFCLHDKGQFYSLEYVRLLPSQSWEIEILCCLMITCQKDGLESLRKVFLGCKIRVLNYKSRVREIQVESFKVIF